MITDEEDNVAAKVMPLEIVWRNPVFSVLAQLRLREASNLYYGWAEQARKIRAPRANWRRQSQRGGMNSTDCQKSCLSRKA